MKETKVLIVEDEAIVASDLRRTLKSWGYTVPAVVYSGEAAIQKAAELRPDLVLMDIVLKGKVDGIEAAAQIRSRFDIPVIFVTAYADEEMLRRARITEPFGYILKPFAERELHINIQMALYKHQMERKLRESEEKFRAITENTTDITAILDQEGVYRYVSPSIYKVFGYSPEEVLGKPPDHFAHPDDDMSLINDALVHAMREPGATIHIPDFRVRHRDGHWLYLEGGFTSMLDVPGVSGVVFNGRDITERKRAEEELEKHREYLEELVEERTFALRESEEKYRTLFQGSSHPIVIYDGDAVILMINSVGARNLNLPPEECIGKSLREMIPDKYVVSVQRFRQVIYTGVKMQVEDLVKLPSGPRWFWSTIEPVSDASGRVYGVQVISYDITERKRTEEALCQKVADQTALYEASQVFLGQLDVETVLENISQLATEQFGLKMAWVGLVDKDSFDVRPASAYGFEEGYLASIRVTWDEGPTGRGPTGTAIRTAQAVPMNRIDADPTYTPWRAAALERGYRSSAALPLLHGEEVLGALNVYSAEPEYFTSDRIQVLQSYANLAAVALEEARLFEQVGRHAAELEQRVAERTAELTKANEKLEQEIAERVRAEAALRESEERYRQLVEISPDAVVVHSEGKIVLTNAAGARLLGVANPEQLVGKPVMNFVHPDYREVVEKRVRQVIEGGTEVPFIEQKITRSDGTDVDVEVATTPFTYQGKPAAQVVARDITQRKRVDNLIRTQRDLALALSAAPRLDKGLRLCVEAALHVSEMDCCGVYLIEETSGALDLVFYKGLPSDFVRSVSHYDADSANARLVMVGEPVYTEHLALGVPLDETERQESLCAIAVLPMRHEGQVIGCLNVASHTFDKVPVFARDALETIAAQIGSSIAHLKAEEALQQLAHDLGKRVKELNCLYGISDLVEKRDTLEEILQGTVELIPFAWQYPEVTCARVVLEDQEFRTENFRETAWKQASDVIVFGKPSGSVEVCYLEEKPAGDEGSFLKEERGVLNVIAKRLGRISERVRAEEQIKASLQEKEVLLREVHHRVKNNLQIISGLLEMSGKRTARPEVAHLFREAQARIHTMALIHSQLYQSERFDQINMERHIRQLVGFLGQAHAPQSRSIVTSVESSAVTLPLTQAIPCALALNEVLSNAFEHAFPEGQGGTIQISIRRRADDTIVISVQDDGVCIPAEIDVSTADSLGLDLVRGLIQGQLRGKLQIERDHGTRVTMEFKVDKGDTAWPV